MLIVPLGGPADRTFRPWITIALATACVFVYFVLQGRDDQHSVNALKRYLQSDLPNIEFPLYQAELEQRGGKGKNTVNAFRQQLIDSPAGALRTMEADRDFMQRLHDGKLAPPPGFDRAKWTSQRSEFERLAQRSLTQRWSFTPAELGLGSLIGHQFLHGSVEHLVGNLVVLIVIGRMVESLLGRRRYLACYLLSGAAGAIVFSLFAADKSAALVGASGAISGVMGMYAVLLGFRRVEFFYSLIVYFGFFSAPAIAALPIWIANELFQFWNDGASHIAYMAHAGGFIFGALIAVPFRPKEETIEIRNVADSAPDDAADIPCEAEWRRAQRLLGEARVEDALPLLRKTAEARRDDADVVRIYYNVARIDPAGEHYHRAARRMMKLPEAADPKFEIGHATFLDYQRLAKPAPQLDADLAALLIRRFARHDHLEDAECLLNGLLRSEPKHAEAPKALFEVGRQMQKEVDAAKGARYLRLLSEHFPQSPEAQAAHELLPKQTG